FRQPHSYHLYLHSFPTRRSSDLYTPTSRDLKFQPDHAAEDNTMTRRERVILLRREHLGLELGSRIADKRPQHKGAGGAGAKDERSEEHTSELQSQSNLVCRLLLE